MGRGGKGGEGEVLGVGVYQGTMVGVGGGLTVGGLGGGGGGNGKIEDEWEN